MRRCFAITTLTCLLAAPTVQADTLTLQRASAMALAASADVDVARAAQAAAAADRDAASRSWMPRITLEEG